MFVICFSQKKSRSNSAERPFNGASLAVYKQEIPKTTTSESLFGLQNPSAETSSPHPHTCVFAPPQFVQSSSGKGSRNQPVSKDAIVSLEQGSERKKRCIFHTICKKSHLCKILRKQFLYPLDFISEITCTCGLIEGRLFKKNGPRKKPA